MKKALLFLLVSFFGTFIYAQTEATKETMFIAFKAFSKEDITIDETKEAMTRYHNKAHADFVKTINDNEFKYNKYISEKRSDYLDKANSFDRELTYIYKCEANLNSYDFTNNKFPIGYDHDFEGGKINPTGGWWSARNFSGLYEKEEVWSFYKIDATKAEQLLEKIESLNPSRKMLATVYFKYDGTSTEESFFNITNYRVGVVIEKIVFTVNNVEVFTLHK